MTTRKATEKRKYPRIELEDVTVEVYSPEGKLDTPDIGTIINLSENGMLFIGETKYTISQRIRLTFVIPGAIAIIRTDGTVIHTETTRKNCYVGVQFKKLPAQDAATLRHMVSRSIS